MRVVEKVGVFFFYFIITSTASSVKSPVSYSKAKLVFTKTSSSNSPECIDGKYMKSSIEARNYTDLELSWEEDNFVEKECMRKHRSNCKSMENITSAVYTYVCDNSLIDQISFVEREIINCSSRASVTIICIDKDIEESLLRKTLGIQKTVILVTKDDLDERNCPLQSWFQSQTHDVKLSVFYIGNGEITDSFDPDTSDPQPFIPNNWTFTFVMFAFCLLLLLAIVWFIFNYVKRCHTILRNRRNQEQVQTQTRKAINHCNLKTYKKTKLAEEDPEGVNEEDRCAICLEDYKPRDVIRQLYCNHEFHKSCVDPWLYDKRTCPLCKVDIVTAYEDKNNSRSSSHRSRSEDAVTVNVSDQSISVAVVTGEEMVVTGEEIVVVPQQLQESGNPST